MFRITSKNENGLSFIELQNSTKTTTAKICLEQGARLQELKFNNVFVIKEIPSFNYKNSYASSILFPFASRIENGAYTFEGTDYQFDKNDGENALHGLLYNKEFELFEPEEHKNDCSATFNYFEKNESSGFPFTYYFSVTYTLTENNLKVRITVKNSDKKPFPFTLGWHPYFFTDTLNESSLSFKSDKKVEFNSSLITKEIVDYTTPEVFNIEEKQLDDCFILNDTKTIFNTKAYQIEISSNVKTNFLQLYTPPNLPLIAIEPMTGISNSFNNKIGLQVLEPQETFSVTWNLKAIIN